MKINIVNKHTHNPTEFDIYIGRGTPIGNPFTHLKNIPNTTKCETREEAVLNYKKWIYQKIRGEDAEILAFLKKIIAKLKINGQVNLVCYCSPKKCHGEIIKKIIEYNLNFEQKKK